MLVFIIHFIHTFMCVK